MIVAVLGTGQRGRDIAQRCVRAGHAVRLRGTDATDVMDRVDDIRRALNGDVSAGIDGTTGLESAVSGSDIVIDATDGGTDAHREVVAETETMVEAETLIAVSDTSLSVTAVATGLRNPGRAVGLNLVDPPDGAIAEVVIAEQTTAATRDRVAGFVESLDASPVIVRDTPGFAALRLELATIAEAVRMVEDGVAGVRDIDQTFERGDSNRDGPLVRADRHGLETVLTALENLADRLDERFEPPALLRQKVDDGQRGAVAGEGFYVWENGTPTTGAEPDPEVPTRDSESDRR
ncbi:3-hydroxyacyl-CoA dehydrogenase family protein [Haloarcula sp. CBA1130]|uniref:3-hydroxyacyl-CoA dehydrogenase family protein n=1 Tax=unclassified Haloarcula TaxID=2624677 RepID=UPI001245462C|nr:MULTISPECIES: 3-hydroxyacyl-CoA dehydrogenase family protein [unclassified Haloarcula]KAA9396931.1 3-hydroxyacyl-CoA dehydrogenase family protein [Haloarcula sp. CBA1129]KAA9403031.1 3-hydroxyacyl-CoA dehydrogenase family protein [Haloarcula sp. CBA1130]